MDLLQDEMAESSRELRKAAARRIAAVGVSIGPDSVRDEMIPFLAGKIDDDDEILLIVAQQLGECGAKVFHNGEGALCLLQPLEALAAVEETVVRDAAVAATCKVIDGLPDGAAQNAPTELVMRLATGDWFTKKVSACGMVASAYSRSSSEGKQELLDMYVTNLCVDDAPMVRRAAAKQLGAVASKVGTNQVLAKIMPAYEKLCIKDTDSVRILAMGQTSKLAALLEDDNSRKQTLLRIMDDCHKDRSWRVRAALAADLGPIASASGASFTTDALLTIATVLIGDPEPEVREIAMKQLSSLCKVVGANTFVERMLPEINTTRFSEEEEIKVQTAFAQAVMDLIPMLGSESDEKTDGGSDGVVGSEVAKNQLLPLITQALTRQLDEESEGFQHMMQAMINMKLKVFRRMDDLMTVLSPDGAQTFTDEVLLNVVGKCSFTEHYEDSNGGLVALYDKEQYNWRARQSTVSIVPKVVQTVSNHGASKGAAESLMSMNSKLFQQYITGLNDPISGVRNSCADAMGDVVEAVGTDWFKERVVPLLESHMGAQKIDLQAPRRQPDGSDGKYMRPVIGDDGDSENVVAVKWTEMPKGGFMRRQAVMRAMASVGKFTELEPVVVRFLERGLKDKVFNVQIVSLRSVMKLLPAIGASEALK
jgi:hypothetical protein